MKTKHLLFLVLIAAFSSCSSAFKTGQTPDDVYYSPAPAPPVEYVSTDNQQDRDTYANHNSYNNEDLSIGSGINDPMYLNNIPLDFGYGYSPLDSYGSSLYNPNFFYYNPYASTGITFYTHNYNYYGYYSPFTSYYYPPITFYNYISPAGKYTGPRTYNLGAYNNNVNTNTRAFSHPGQPTTSNSAPVRTLTTQPANGTGVGNFIRRIVTPSNNTRSFTNDNNNFSPARTTQTNTSSGSNSSSGRSSSGAPVRTFR